MSVAQNVALVKIGTIDIIRRSKLVATSGLHAFYQYCILACRHGNAIL